MQVIEVRVPAGGGGVPASGRTVQELTAAVHAALAAWPGQLAGVLAGVLLAAADGKAAG